MIALFLLLTTAHADPDPEPAPDPDAAWGRALQAEREGQPEALAASCRALLVADPEHRRARTCLAQLRALDARRDADGSLASWSRLEGARRAPRDAARVDVQALWDDPATPSIVRAEAALWLAHDALEREDPATALRLTQAMIFDPLGEPQLGRRAVDLRAAALASVGRVDEARAVQASLDPDSTGTSRADRIARERRRGRWAQLGGLSFLAGIALLAPGLLGWLRAPRPRLWSLIPVLVACLGAWLLAEAWQPGAGAAVPPFTAGAVALHLLTLGVGAALSGRSGSWPIRAGAGLVAATSTLGLAYVCLWWTRTLDWVGG